MRLTLLLLFLNSFIFAKCIIPYEIMYALGKNERHLKRDVGYPYLISFNKTKHYKRFAKKYKRYFMDKRTIDCRNKSKCVSITKDIIVSGITNIDLGAFQTNYRYYKYPISDYFSLNQSYANACSILTKLKNDYGWSWQTIGKYHSFRKKQSLAYAKRIHDFVYKR